jgi:hypothetical protein
VTIKPDLEDVSGVSEDFTGSSLSTVVLDTVEDVGNSPCATATIVNVFTFRLSIILVF